jgi:hypothetical protein
VPKKQFGSKPLKPGELLLLKTIWKLQEPEFFKKPVTRHDVLIATRWTEHQFSAFYNDLRVRSKTHYIEGGKTYKLIITKLLHRPRSASVLLLFERFTQEQKGRWPDGEVPLNTFIEWINSISETPMEIALDVTTTAIKRFYLAKNIVEGVLYVAKADRFEIEKEWIEFLAKQRS